MNRKPQRKPAAHAGDQTRSSLMARVKSKNTGPEMLARAWLRKRGIHYRTNVKSMRGSPDIVVVRKKLAIFVHGCFWHGHRCPRGRRPISRREFWDRKLDRNQERDKEAARSLRKEGWRVSTIWACSIKSGMARLERILRET